MVRSLASLVSGVLFSINVFGQNVKQIEVIGAPITNKDVIFVSDVHGHNGDMSFMGSMSVYAHEQYRITNIAVEFGRSFAYLINRYIQDDDSTIFSYMSSPVNIRVLEQWRMLNKRLPGGSKLTVYGVDFERMLFIPVLKTIFKKHEEVRNTALYRYIFSLPDSLSYLNTLVAEQKEVRKETYGKATTLFKQEQQMLKPLLKDDYQVVEDILENPVTEKQMGKRDITMPQSLYQQLGDKRFICFLGGEHTNVYRHFSAVNKYMRNKHRRDITIINEVCKNFPKKPYNYKDTGKAPVYITLGTKDFVTNEELQRYAFNKYRRPGYYSLVDQGEFKEWLKKDNKGISTYYVFSDLLNE